MLIYGANGYTGTLITELALEQGLRPHLAGRNPEKLKIMGERYGLPCSAFDLEDSAVLDRNFKDQRLVINCAGPFSHTFRQVAAACLRQRIHYLDITGEIQVFEGLAAMHHDAVQAGVMLLPGVGFDVVPTDCLAMHLKDRMPTATRLVLAFRSSGGLSHGTRRTMLEGLGRDGAIRRDGRIVPVEAAWKTRMVDFGDGRAYSVVSIPWGDVSTAWYSTGIPNIETYVAMKPSQIRSLRLSRHFGWLLRSKLVQWPLQRRIAATPPGPDAATRHRTETLVWGEVCDANGQCVYSRLRCGNGYSLTSRSAVAAAKRVLNGDIKPGFQTPSRAFGIGFVLALGARISDQS
ncbi:MAG: saccharopine dehydrogenase NADP-binding domain-containing protein [Gammaproteobacteria bacterium]|nr:saccharopine dehydrogenase NADP-binding domain-containing protein [Gammaproteobacteria bacterium]MDE2345247.1 saccharopine dehydrogenase NADP-binding domain-containing protein [Gammaproteobacteria bacterium]